MLVFDEKNDEQLVTLKHSLNVFHEALALVKKGETRFHVTDDNGRVPDYDLTYTANMLLFPEHVRKLILKMTNGGSTLGTFLVYDEENTDMLCLDFLRQYKKIEIEKADEYSVMVALMALRHTDIPIYHTDEKLEWFFEDQDRLHRIDSFDEEKSEGTLHITPSVFDMGYTKRDWSVLGSVSAFQNIFFWQHFMEGKPGPFKYLEVVLSPITGIGGILSIMSMLSNVAAQKGYTAFLRPGCTRYPEQLLCRYFRINAKPEDSTTENTISVDDLAILTTTWYVCQFPARFDESILDAGFAGEMNEYATAVIGGKKTLGVLARGTDYVTTNLGDDRVHAKPAHMIPVIREWMKEGGYEKIFLATEDKDIYNEMLAAFPGQVVVIAQERHSVDEMREKNTTLIYEFEREINSGKAYADALEDTTVNYFYALYILSKCDAFMCSGQCNGWDVVRAFNKGSFEKEYKFTVGIDKNNDGRAVGSAILSGKSFMYTDSSFKSVGARLKFREKVDPKTLQATARQALVANRWVTYGIFEKDGSFYYHDELINDIAVSEHDWEDLPAIGGADMEGHLLGVFYKDDTVTITAFHGLTDGGGLTMFIDSLLEAYAAYKNGESHTPEAAAYEDGNAEPFEIAGRLFDEMNLPQIKAGDFMNKEPFLIPVDTGEKGSLPTHILIKADAKEYMQFAKKLGVRPVTVLVSLYAKAVLKVMGDTDRKVKVAVPIDFRNALEIPHTFRNCAMPPLMLDLSPEIVNGDLQVLAATVQAVMNNMTGKAAGVSMVKVMADMMGQMPPLPYKDAAGMFAGMSNGPIFSFNVSYARRLTDKDHPELLDSYYYFYPADKGQSVLEMVALPDTFCICMNQGSDSTDYADALCAVFKDNGISSRIEDVLKGNPGYVELREYEKWL